MRSVTIDKMNKSLISFFKKYLIGTGILMVALLVISWVQPNPVLKNGTWRATLQRQDGQQIVFNFKTFDNAGKKMLYVINAAEQLLVDSIGFQKDSVFIQMPFFESGFRAKITGNGNLEGIWIKKTGDVETVLPFRAVYNQIQRFPAPLKPRYNVSGRWAVSFNKKDNRLLKAVGEFNQNGNQLTGTFLLPSGDYRYLQGVVTGDSLKLSAFDGSHAFLFTAKIENNNTISDGNFYSVAT